MKIIAVILIIVPFLSFSQAKEGYIDENGWKQGMHVGYSGSFAYERTYVNDTLNGPFKKYSKKEKTIWTTGFYKNKEYDSLWIEYYADGSIETTKNFKEGKKQGDFKEYYISGELKYEAVFDYDSLVGNSNSYFENGQIKSQGNRKNGAWKTFYENNQLKSVENFRNNLLVGEVEKFNLNGDKILPIFIPEHKSDTSVVNETGLNVKVLYETNKKNRKLSFGKDLFIGAKVCEDNGDLILKYGSAIIAIKANGVELHQTNEILCRNEITTTKYGINRLVKELPSGEWDIKYVEEKIEHKTSYGNLTVDVQNAKCDDTGTNPITINHNGQILSINSIDNLQFFEFDVDENGINELYILSYASCSGYLKVYKIEK